MITREHYLNITVTVGNVLSMSMLIIIIILLLLLIINLSLQNGDREYVSGAKLLPDSALRNFPIEYELNGQSPCQAIVMLTLLSI